jgi:hypothetical protein
LTLKFTLELTILKCEVMQSPNSPNRPFQQQNFVAISSSNNSEFLKITRQMDFEFDCQRVVKLDTQSKSSQIFLECIRQFWISQNNYGFCQIKHRNLLGRGPESPAGNNETVGTY